MCSSKMPRTGVASVAVPASTHIHASLPGAYFADCYQMTNPRPDAPALQVWLDLVRQTPGWVNALMGLRNRIVARLGLKDLGRLGGRPQDLKAQASQYQVGDRVGIFVIRQLSPHEVVMGQDDRHLEVQVSLAKQLQGGQAVLCLSTVVHVHNRLGRAYMAVVEPFHRIIARSMLARAAR